jgi:hypothetical protein
MDRRTDGWREVGAIAFNTKEVILILKCQIIREQPE